MYFSFTGWSLTVTHIIAVISTSGKFAVDPIITRGTGAASLTSGLRWASFNQDAFPAMLTHEVITRICTCWFLKENSGKLCIFFFYHVAYINTLQKEGTAIRTQVSLSEARFVAYKDYITAVLHKSSVEYKYTQQIPVHNTVLTIHAGVTVFTGPSWLTTAAGNTLKKCAVTLKPERKSRHEYVYNNSSKEYTWAGYADHSRIIFSSL